MIVIYAAPVQLIFYCCIAGIRYKLLCLTGYPPAVFQRVAPCHSGQSNMDNAASSGVHTQILVMKFFVQPVSRSANKYFRC